MKTELRRCTAGLLAAAMVFPTAARAQYADGSPFPPSGFHRGVAFEERSVVRGTRGQPVNLEGIGSGESNRASIFPVSGRSSDVAYEQRVQEVDVREVATPAGCAAANSRSRVGGGIGGGGGGAALVLLPILLVALVVVGVASVVNREYCRQAA